MTDSYDERFAAIAAGTTTLAELEGLTAAEAYAIADFGWMLLEQGRFEPARLVFETLTLANPRHAYFHALLGSALQRAGDAAGALEAYGRALETDPNETAALVNRAELLAERGDDGDVEEVARLLERALTLDAAGTRPETRRARGLAAALTEASRPGVEPV